MGSSSQTSKRLLEYFLLSISRVYGHLTHSRQDALLILHSATGSISNTNQKHKIFSSNTIIPCVHTKREKYCCLRIWKSNMHNILNACSYYNSKVCRKQDCPTLTETKFDYFNMFCSILRTIMQVKTWMLACCTQIFVFPPLGNSQTWGAEDNPTS